MQYLLIPSRHIIYSKEQYRLLAEHLRNNTYEYIIFAITSYNLNNCKYSPIHIHHRITMVNSLIYKLQEEFSFSYKIETIPHFNQADNYADTILKYLNYNLAIDLNKNTTEIFCYGAHLGKKFTDAGYTTHTKIALDHVGLFRELFSNDNQTFFHENISDSSRRVLDNQQEVMIAAKKIWLDKVLQEKGGITDTRNYHTYTHDMSNEKIIDLKYGDIKEYLVEGKIVDEGCADAALFIPIAKHFPDSDLIGVDISNDFIARANERIREGYYGNSFVNIIQANLLDKIFEDNFVNTVICNSTMHEIWSYNKKEESLRSYLQLKYDQLVDGGRLIVRDVIGPEDSTRTVYMRSMHDNNELFKKLYDSMVNIYTKIL